MKLKKLLALILILSLAAGLCSCKVRNSSKSAKDRSESEALAISESSTDVENEELLNSQSKSESESDADAAKDTVPEETAKAFLYAAKSGERSSIEQYVKYNTLFSIKDEQAPDWIFQQILLRMKYEIASSNVEDDKATVSVKITNVDMSKVLPGYYQKSMQIQYDNAVSDKPKAKDELELQYKAAFVETVAQYETVKVDNLVDVELEKKDDKWQINPSAKLGNAMLGGYVDTQQTLSATMEIEADSSSIAESSTVESESESEESSSEEKPQSSKKDKSESSEIDQNLDSDTIVAPRDTDN